MHLPAHECAVATTTSSSMHRTRTILRERQERDRHRDRERPTDSRHSSTLLAVLKKRQQKEILYPE